MQAPTLALAPASTPAADTRRPAEVVSLARRRLARMFPGRSRDDRDDALQQAAEAAVRGGWLGKRKAATYLALHAARILCGGYWIAGRWQVARSAATSIAGPARPVAGGEGAAVGPDEWLAEVVAAEASAHPDAEVQRLAAAAEVVDPERPAPATFDGARGRDVLRELLRRGWSLAELGDELGVEQSTVGRWSRTRPPVEAGDCLRALLRLPSPTDPFRRLLCEARAVGYSLRAIGIACGVSHEAAAQWGKGAAPLRERRAEVERALLALIESADEDGAGAVCSADDRGCAVAAAA
jgi:transcriptional regulator with XRE-family HTH domain